MPCFAIPPSRGRIRLLAAVLLALTGCAPLRFGDLAGNSSRMETVTFDQPYDETYNNLVDTVRTCMTGNTSFTGQTNTVEAALDTDNQVGSVQLVAASGLFNRQTALSAEIQPTGFTDSTMTVYSGQTEWDDRIVDWVRWARGDKAC
jgi:hypothetical protein